MTKQNTFGQMDVLIRCERCGKKFKENDLEVDEDTHDLLCPKCYHQGLSREREA